MEAFLIRCPPARVNRKSYKDGEDGDTCPERANAPRAKPGEVVNEINETAYAKCEATPKQHTRMKVVAAAEFP